MLVQLADWCYRQRRLVVVLWIAALAAAFALASSFGGETKQDYLQPGSESQAAAETLQAKFPQKAGDTVQVVLHSEDGFSSAAVRTQAEDIFADVAADPHVTGVASPFSEGGASQISHDGTTAYAVVALDKTADEYTPAQAKALIDPVLAAGDDTLRVEAGGPVAALSQTAPAGGEGIGLIAAALILLFTFGSAVAMGLPLLTAVFGLGMSIALGELLRRVVDVPDWATATAAMVGIGVGIDYALLIVTRYRSSLAEGRDPRQATLTAIATAGRAVVFAGLTVVVAMLGILLVGQPALAGFAFTASLFVLVTMTASLTLLPATARLRRTQHRTPARAVREQAPARLRHHPLVPLEPVHPAPPLDRRDRRARRPAGAGGPVPRHAPGVPRRPERPAVLHDPPGLRPDRRRVRPRLLGTPGAHRPRGVRQRAAHRERRDGQGARRGRAAWPSSPRPSSTTPATPPS